MYVARRSLQLTLLLLSTGLLASLTGCVRDEGEGILSDMQLPVREIASVVDMRMRAQDMPPGRHELIYSTTPYLGQDEIVSAFTPIARAISRRLGVPVRFEPVPTYKEMIDRTVERKIDIMQLSPLSYVLARDAMKNLRMLGSTLSFGSSSYSSFILIRAGDDITSLEDLKGRKVGFVDERSSSGFLFPYAAFLRQNIDPEHDLEMVFTKGHMHSLKMLRDGEIDAAAVSSGTLNDARRNQSIVKGDLRILYKAGRIPYDALCVSPAISETGAKKIAAAFGSLSTRTHEGRGALFKAHGLTGWIRADNTSYDEIRNKLKLVRANHWRSWKVSAVKSPKVSTRTRDHDAR